MSTRLTRIQAAILGLLVVAVLGLGSAGLIALAAKDRLWADTFEFAVALPDASDVPPGTPVRIRGVNAGQVCSVEYPTSDGRDSVVRIVLRLEGQYRGRIFNDAVVRIQPVGLLGSKAIAIHPGMQESGILANNLLTAKPATDINDVTEKLSTVADEAGQLLKEARGGNGTFAKLVKDDSLYREMNAAATNANLAVAKVNDEAANVRGFVADGRDTLRSVRQSTDALQRMPLIRGYVENAAALLVRPDCRREVHNYDPRDLFEESSAILHDRGRGHLANLTELLKGDGAKFDIVVSSLVDPNDSRFTGNGAQELTRKQAEVVVEYLKSSGAHKTGFWKKNHTLTALGLGTGPAPLNENLPPTRLTVYAFFPQ